VKLWGLRWLNRSIVSKSRLWTNFKLLDLSRTYKSRHRTYLAAETFFPGTGNYRFRGIRIFFRHRSRFDSSTFGIGEKNFRFVDRSNEGGTTCGSCWFVGSVTFCLVTFRQSNNLSVNQNLTTNSYYNTWKLRFGWYWSFDAHLGPWPAFFTNETFGLIKPETNRCYPCTLHISVDWTLSG